MVTKVRFIVEKILGFLKNFEGLNNIRNTIAGHISIDFRIACAMHNFTFKPCVVDSSNSEKIAKEIRIKADNLTTNKLDFLLYKHFGFNMKISRLYLYMQFRLKSCWNLRSRCSINLLFQQ